MRGTELNVELPLYNFREYELGRFQPLVPGMDLLVKIFTCRELPKLVFGGNKAEAMKKRREIRNADPARQEKKRVARLEELKLKMEEMKRRKEEQLQDKKKRKREEMELAESAAKAEDDDFVVDDDALGGDGGENQETDLLESALDAALQEGAAKTREEAEEDRQKLLAGELLVEGADSDDEEMGYTGDGARQQTFFQTDKSVKSSRSLPIPPEQAEKLKKLGYAIVSDDESKVLGTGMVPPWKASSGEDGQDPPKQALRNKRISGQIKFLNSFDVVELDARGHVIDKGDEDYTPSEEWTGRRAGFEFKMGERGLGYYRTGKKVVVPSNTAY